MFKKSLAAMAVMGAFASGASAADVTLYGVADMGLFYNSETVKVEGKKTVDQQGFALESGKNAGSRFGLKGGEDLGNGVKLSFLVENSFSADDGALGMGRLFGREASVTLSSDFGKLSVGRMGGVGSSAGSYDLVFSTGDAFDGGDNLVLGLATSSRYDNMVTYQTPAFAGLQGTFQYSFKGDSTAQPEMREGSAAVDRYASAALTGDFGAVNTVLAYEFLNYASNNGTNALSPEREDGQIIYLGGNYDCGFAKTFVLAQYFKGVKLGAVSGFASRYGTAENDNKWNEGVKGFGVAVGTQFPLLAGNTKVGLYYVDGTAETNHAAEGDRDAKYMGLSARYEYPLSKRTSIYTGAGFGKSEVEALPNGKDEHKQTVTQAYAGLTHKF